MSLFKPSAGSLMLAIASGENERVRAASISGTRKALGPAPVTATRTPALALAHHDADDGIAGGGVGEFDVSGALRQRERHAGDQFARLERGREHPHKEIIGGNCAFFGVDGGAETEDGGGIIGGRIGIGERAADGAAIADVRIADAAGEMGKRGERAADVSGCRHIGVARHGADRDFASSDGDSGKFR